MKKFLDNAIVRWLILLLSFAIGLVAIVFSISYRHQLQDQNERDQSVIAMANGLQAQAVKSGGFALMTIPGPTNYISVIRPSGFAVGTPRMEIDEIVSMTEFFNYPKEIQLSDIDGHVIDQFEFGQTVLPGDLVIAWYVDPTSIRPGKYPKSFLGTLPRYWNPDTGFAVSIIHSVVETP